MYDWGGNVFLSTGAITLVQGQAQNISLSFGATHPTFVDPTEVFNLSRTSCGTAETGIPSFDNQFFESPEPSTFGLLGAALIGIGAILFRRRNLQSSKILHQNMHVVGAINRRITCYLGL
jgi:hypothetical protein